MARKAGSGGWITDTMGVQPGGDVGGDIQAGESYAVRYRRPDQECAIITCTAFPAQSPTRPGVFFVQVQTEWLVCADPRDPGGTEIWSESDTYDEAATYDSAAEAQAVARRVATSLLDDAASHDWDGLPPQ
jgi:hypothetical protein